MNRPENGTLIVPRIDKLEDGTFTTLIRRLYFIDSLIVSKEVLLLNGEWEIVPEGGKYPEAALLPVTHRVVDRAEEAKRLEEWEAQDAVEGWWTKAAQAAWDRQEVMHGNS